MKNKQMLSVVFALLPVTALMVGCAAPAAAPTAAPAQPPAAAKKPFIPVISKGFQHQFWQAVKLGSQNAAKDLNVDITFEGPETEAVLDKRVEMFHTAFDQKPAAAGVA